MKLSPKARASLDRVVARFKSGDLSPIIQVARLKLPDGHPAANWSLGNRVLAFAQAGTLDCRGFKQWQSVDRNVKKGAHGVYILRPLTLKREDKEMGEERRFCVGFQPIPVFPVDGTEGEDVPVVYQPVQLPPLLDVAERLGVRVKYLPVPETKLGDCNVTGTDIRLGTHDEAVFFHELAHAAHARIEGKLKGGQHKEQETVAEFTAAVLMELYGIRDHSGNAWRYIAQYSRDPIVAVAKALNMVEQVLTLLTCGHGCKTALRGLEGSPQAYSEPFYAFKSDTQGVLQT